MTIMLIQHQLLANNSNRTTTLNKEIESDLEKVFLKANLIRINRFYVKTRSIKKERKSRKQQAYLSVLTVSMNKAMRYYRLWIYTCNAVLLISVICFIIIGSKIVVFEPKRMLIPNFSLSQPSLIYAYSALLFQSGFLQFIGCVGAIKLNEKLLNIYWLLLLLLLFGDVMLGVFWIYRYKDIMHHLHPNLKYRLVYQYPTDSAFGKLWDETQSELQCCGVDSFQDYILFNSTSSFLHTADSLTNSVDRVTTTTTVTLPASCCYLPAAAHPHLQLMPVAAALRPTHYTHSTTSTSTMTPIASTTASGSTSEREVSLYSQIFQCSDQMQTPYKVGCHEKVAAWIRSVADILFVIGFCVISFLKLCFTGILRYEIREMVQKIKILEDKRMELLEAENTATRLGPKHYEHNGSIIGVVKETVKEPGLESSRNRRSDLFGNSEVDQTRLSPVLVVNENEREGNEETDERKERGKKREREERREREEERPIGGTRQQSSNTETMTTVCTGKRAATNQVYITKREEEEDDDDMMQNTPLLSHSASSPANYVNTSTKSRLQRSFLSTILNHHDYGNDSDTNSHCALLITDDIQQDANSNAVAEEDETTRRKLDDKQRQKQYQRSHSNGNGNGNNNSYEMKEMSQKLRHSQSHRDRELVSPNQI